MKKEQVYDEQIYPLMAKIISVCEENKIDMVSTFLLDKKDGDEFLCSTLINHNNSRVITECRNIIYGDYVAVPSFISATITTK